MRLWLLGLCAVCRAFRKEEEATRKYKELVDRTLSAASGALLFEGNEMLPYLAQPRGYDLVLFFTTRSCKFCLELQLVFEETARLYLAQNAFRPRRRGAAGALRPPRFFAVVNLSQGSQAVIGRFGLQSVPTLVHSSPAEAAALDAGERRALLEDRLWLVSSREGHVDLGRVLGWVNERLGEEVRAEKSPMRVLRLLLVLGLLAGGLASLCVLLPGLVLNERVWLVGGLGVFAVAAGGVMAALKNGAGLVDDSPAGPVFIRRGTRMQTVGEGFIVMALVLGSAFALIGATSLLRRARRGAPLACLFLLGGALWALLVLEGIFRSKNFYSPALLPPAYYIRGPVVRDHGLAA